jgi:hypothetical protein
MSLDNETQMNWLMAFAKKLDELIKLQGETNDLLDKLLEVARHNNSKSR